MTNYRKKQLESIIYIIKHNGHCGYLSEENSIKCSNCILAQEPNNRCKRLEQVKSTIELVKETINEKYTREEKEEIAIALVEALL